VLRGGEQLRGGDIAFAARKNFLGGKQDESEKNDFADAWVTGNFFMDFDFVWQICQMRLAMAEPVA
jgi:hypothetical protein